MIQDEHNLSAGWISRKGPVHFNYGHIISGAGLLILYGGKMKRLLSLLLFFMLTITAAPLFSQENDAEGADQKEKVKPTSVFQMGEIVVRDRALASVEEASTTTEITDADIKARGDKTLGDALEAVPGLKVFTSAKGNVRFNIRGFDQEYVAMFIDGIPVNDVYEGNFDISQVPVANVSRIVVNRGVSSALYGTNGSAGAINVITKKPEAMYTDVSAEYGQYNNYALNVAHGAPIGDFYYWLTANMMNSDGYKVSSKLDKKERRKWFDKLVRYDLYINSGTGLPYTFDDITLKSKDAYINDTGKWDHTEYTKYQLTGKAGYNITDNVEAGITASYYQTEQKSSSFRGNLFSSYSAKDGEWGGPFSPGWAGDIYADDSRAAIFQNRVFNWPKKYDLSISPYISAEFDRFAIRANVFFYRQMTDLVAYADQDYTIPMFTSYPNSSIWTEESYGINIYPEYRLADWNKLNFAILYRKDSHTEEEKAKEAPGHTTYGTDKFKTKFLEADVITIAVEDEMQLPGNVKLTAGVSYDAQKFNEYKSMDKLSVYADRYMAKDDSMIWGTRDSFNPVVTVIWDAIKDTVKLRAAASSKTKFPTLGQYTDVVDGADIKVKSERSYNASTGFEITPLGDSLNFRTDYFYSRFNDKISKIYDESQGKDVTTNIDGIITQGVETYVSGTYKDLAGIADISAGAGYTYVHASLDSNVKSEKVNKGERIEDTPAHVFLIDLRIDFISNTSLNINGQHTRDQVKYAMKTAPAVGPGDYSTDYFTAVKLHNPYMFNIKISQKIMENYEVYVMCKNIFDDYNADPFNPGPGRMFYFGGSASF